MKFILNSQIEGKRMNTGHSYHNLLPNYLQDVLKRAVNHEGGEARLTNPAYVGQLDRAVKRVREGFPQAFKKA